MLRNLVAICLACVISGCESRSNKAPDATSKQTASEISLQRDAQTLVHWLTEADGTGRNTPVLVPAIDLRNVSVSLDDDTALIGQARLPLRASDIRDYGRMLESLAQHSPWDDVYILVDAFDSMLAAVMKEAADQKNEMIFVNASIMRIELIEIEKKYVPDGKETLEKKKNILKLLAKNANLTGDYYVEKIP